MFSNSESKESIVLNSSGKVLGSFNPEKLAVSAIEGGETPEIANFQSNYMEKIIKHSNLDIVTTDGIRYAVKQLKDSKPSEPPSNEVSEKITQYLVERNKEFKVMPSSEFNPIQSVSLPKSGWKKGEVPFTGKISSSSVPIVSIRKASKEKIEEKLQEPYANEFPEKFDTFDIGFTTDLTTEGSLLQQSFVSRNSDGVLTGEQDSETGKVDEEDVELPGGYEDDCYIMTGKANKGCTPVGKPICKHKGTVIAPVRLEPTWNGTIVYGKPIVKTQSTHTVQIIISRTLIMKGIAYNKLYTRVDCCCSVDVELFDFNGDCWTELRYRGEGQKRKLLEKEI